MANAYDVGDLVRFTATFIASGGVLTDPGQVWFLVKLPDGSAATHRYGLTPSAIFKAGAGGYYIDVDVELRGDWRYRWEATGTLQVAEEGAFNVRQTFKL